MEPRRKLLQGKVISLSLDVLSVLHSNAIQSPENRTWFHAAVHSSQPPLRRSRVRCSGSQGRADGLDTLKHLSGK